MLPYPNQQHFGFSQEQPHPNPTASRSFPMAPPAAAHLDQQQYYDHFFPGQGQGQGHQYFNSETLEAVLIRPPRASAASERAEAVVVTVPQGATRNNNSVAGQAGGQGQGLGHARARKRPFRTDRHSKIRTAQGVRDRRMRLSLDVARDFFALQDRLGFDKASKTVDWLLTQSKPAIDRLSAESASHHRGSGGDAAMSSSPMSAEIVRDTAATGSGGGGGVGAEKAAATMSRNGALSSAFMDHHGCGELDRLVAAAPVLGEYYYEFGANGGEGDNDGEYDEDDGDFLDGMQY